MSVGIMPYLTDLAAIRRLRTSGACVIEEIVARQRDHIDHSEPGVEQAMRAIVRGHLYEGGTGGSTFGYAVEQFLRLLRQDAGQHRGVPVRFQCAQGT